MKIIKVEGVVISQVSYKESSKILNILTSEYGIVGVISKGCKSLKSKLRLISEKFAYGSFDIYYKENALSTLVDGKIINYFENIKKDIIKLSYLTYLTELSTYVYKESESNDIYKLYIEGILKIEEGLEPKIIANILELKFLKYLGLALCLDGCVRCGNKKIVTFSLSKGGYVCNKCKTNDIIYDEKVLKMIRMYNYVDISKISDLKIDNSIRNQINDILTLYYEQYSGLNLKSKKFLNMIE